MPTVTNQTDKQVCIRTGRDNTEYRFFFVAPKGKIKVDAENAKRISDRIKEAKILGVTVSKHLPRPLKKPKQEQPEKVPASVEVVADTEQEQDNLLTGGREPLF